MKNSSSSQAEVHIRGNKHKKIEQESPLVESQRLAFLGVGVSCMVSFIQLDIFQYVQRMSLYNRREG